MRPGFTYTVGLDSDVGFKTMCVFGRGSQIAIAPTNQLHKNYGTRGLFDSPACSSLSSPRKIQAFLPKGDTNYMAGL